MNGTLVDSVFPAPDSPDTMIDWEDLSTFMSRKALSAMAKTCGGIVPRDLPAIDRYTAFLLQKKTPLI